MSVSIPRACALAAGPIAILTLAGPASAFPQPKYPPALRPAASSSAPASTTTPEPQSAPAPRPAEAKPAAASGSWSVYLVQHGDTLTGVGRRFGEPVRTLADLNQLDAKTPLKAGSRIRLPPGAADAGKDPYASGPSPSSLGESSHPAAEEKPKPPRVTRVAVEAAPKPDAAMPVSLGESSHPAADEKPKPPRVSHVAAEAAPKPAAATPARETSAERPPARQTQAKAQPQPQPQAETASPPSEAQKPAEPAETAHAGAPVSDAAAAGRGRFIWPIRGRILMAFGPLAQGQRNDGLNIAADRGEEVRAAADGVVVYAGSEVKGYGNTVLIMHPGGWDTVYTHLDKIQVGNRGFTVKQGQVIGTVGSTGEVDQPQLHFETRFSPDAHHKYNPVDPQTVLPQ
jgi:murein DD-endopeptidase MepM/ murein hydrolase activator NlpD